MAEDLGRLQPGLTEFEQEMRGHHGKRWDGGSDVSLDTAAAVGVGHCDDPAKDGEYVIRAGRVVYTAPPAPPSHGKKGYYSSDLYAGQGAGCFFDPDAGFPPDDDDEEDSSTAQARPCGDQITDGDDDGASSSISVNLFVVVVAVALWFWMWQ